MDKQHMRFTWPGDQGEYWPPGHPWRRPLNTGELVYDALTVSPATAQRLIDTLIELGIKCYDSTRIRDWRCMTPRQMRDCILGSTPRSERGHYEIRGSRRAVRDIHQQLAEMAMMSSIKSQLFGVAPATAQLNKVQDNTMSNENKYDPKTGALLPKGYESRIKTGDSLVVGKSYRLEVVGGKNPPEIAKAGEAFYAIGDSEGNYNGEVIDLATFRVFSTDASDLWIAA